MSNADDFPSTRSLLWLLGWVYLRLQPGFEAALRAASGASNSGRASMFFFCHAKSFSSSQILLGTILCFSLLHGYGLPASSRIPGQVLHQIVPVQVHRHIEPYDSVASRDRGEQRYTTSVPDEAKWAKYHDEADIQRNSDEDEVRFRSGFYAAQPPLVLLLRTCHANAFFKCKS